MPYHLTLMPHVRPCHVECLSNPNSRNAPASSLLSLCAASTSACLAARPSLGGKGRGGDNHANGISCSPHNEVTLPHLTWCRVRKEDETSDTVIVIGERDEHRARAPARVPARPRGRRHRKCSRIIRHQWN